MDHSSAEVVTIESVNKLTLTMISTLYVSTPTPDYQHKLENQRKDKPEQQSPCEPTHPLLKLPKDIKMCIFDHLDPIDSTSLGLSSRHMYPIYRRRFPQPLFLCQSGVGQLALPWKDRVSNHGTKPARCFCWKCGANRCELHRHIQGFVGRDAFKKQSQRLREKALQDFGPCLPGLCVMKHMGFDPSTKLPCKCPVGTTEAQALELRRLYIRTYPSWYSS